MPIWEVDLLVYGPVTVKRRIHLFEQKGFDPFNPFYSDILIQKARHGLRVTLNARAISETLAHEAAVVFFGQMLDALTLTVNLPMQLSIDRKGPESPGPRLHDVRLQVEEIEFRKAFLHSHALATNSPSYLRSLGWYRKGLCTEDPLDQYLAFWNSIEIVASSYFRYIPDLDKERVKGSKGKIWECFKTVWGECERWPFIDGDVDWIDNGNDTRVAIAHGTKPIKIEWVKEVGEQIDEIQNVAYRFLKDAQEKLLALDRHTPIETVSASPENDLAV